MGSVCPCGKLPNTNDPEEQILQRDNFSKVISGMENKRKISEVSITRNIYRNDDNLSIRSHKDFTTEDQNEENISTTTLVKSKHKRLSNQIHGNGHNELTNQNIYTDKFNQFKESKNKLPEEKIHRNETHLNLCPSIDKIIETESDLVVKDPLPEIHVEERKQNENVKKDNEELFENNQTYSEFELTKSKSTLTETLNKTNKTKLTKLGESQEFKIQDHEKNTITLSENYNFSDIVNDQEKMLPNKVSKSINLLIL